MNGEFAVSSPGSYDAAGARFIYTRSNDQDIVYSHGPLLESIDIMVKDEIFYVKTAFASFYI